MKKFLCFVAMVGLLVGCGTPKEREVTVSDVSITGVIKDYIKVVDGIYKFKDDGSYATISVKLELIEQPQSIYTPGGWGGSVNLNAMGENDEVINTGSYGFTLRGDESEKLDDLLKGNVGDTKTVAFVYDYYNPKDKKDQLIFTTSVSFEIVDSKYRQGSDDNKDNSSNLSASSKSSNSNEWDKVLDEYEKYIDQYIALYKKAMNGDMSAMTEYASMLESANKLGSKLGDAQSDMTAAQMSRYTKISTKMLDAL